MIQLKTKQENYGGTNPEYKINQQSAALRLQRLAELEAPNWTNDRSLLGDGVMR